MFKKILIFIVSLNVAIFAYGGGLHSKYMEAAPKILRDKGSFTMAMTPLENLNIILREGCVSPDRDYPGLKIPDQYLPESLRKYNTSLGRWEHTIPDDVPKEIDKVLKWSCKEFLKKEFKYADATIVDWYKIAKDYYVAGQIDSAMYWLGRCCHLIEDITVPMHCKLSSGLIDAWNTLHHQEPNHEKFERLAGERYKIMTHDYEIKQIKNLQKEMNKIAKKSRRRMRLCNGIGFTKLTKFPLTRWITIIIPCLAEDYDKAVKQSYQQGEEQTIRLILQFFIDAEREKAK